MAANPIFPLYYNDIMRSTADWSDEEFGCYMRLLMHQWAQNKLPKDSQRLARLVTSLEASWPVVGKKFVENDDGLINERLEEIRAERIRNSQKQAANARKSHKNVSGKPKESQNEAKSEPNNTPKQCLHNEYEYEYEQELEKKEESENKKIPLRSTINDYSDLSEHELQLAYEFMFRLGKPLSNEKIVQLWGAFKIHREGHHPETRTRILQHFRNWIKTQPHETTKRNHRPTATDWASRDTVRDPI